MSDLTDFLLARIAEDERAAAEWSRPLADFYVPARPGKLVYRNADARGLAECEAKRRIMGLCRWVADVDWSDYEYSQRTSWLTARATLQHLASVYADHPDYREEWKP